MLVDNFPSEVELGLRLLLAALLGGAIGFEREVREHPAGIRTHLAVAVGACLFGIMSAYGFEEFDYANRNDTTFHVDPTRVASNIVVGVGFLGGGAILKHGVTVQGLTTAASLWVTAAIGAAVALGSYSAAVVTSALLFLSLTVLRRPSRVIARRLRHGRHAVVVHTSGRAVVAPVMTALNEADGVAVYSFAIEEEVGQAVIEAVIEAEADAVDRLAPVLAAIPGVDAVSLR